MSIYDIYQKTRKEFVETIKIQQEQDVANAKLINQLRAENERLNDELNQALSDADKERQRAEQAEREREQRDIEQQIKGIYMFADYIEEIGFGGARATADKFIAVEQIKAGEE